MILDSVGWTDVAMRDLAMGDDLAEWPADEHEADGSRTALELISELLEVELGIFYIDAAGVAVYKDRHMLHGAHVPIHDLADVFTYTQAGPDLELVRNRHGHTHRRRRAGSRQPDQCRPVRRV